VAGLARLFFGVKDSKLATDEALLEIAAELVPLGRCWQWNQVLVE
jgi:hypothetical protein